MLTNALRRGITDADLDLAELRDRAVAISGADDAELVELRRVTSTGLVKGAVVLLLFYTLTSLFGGIDVGELVTQLRDADYALLLLAFFVSPLVQVGLASATRGAVPSSLPYLPVLMLQYGIQFIAVVLPATAARVAVEIRFFERFGIPPGAAATMGMMDGASGFVVQVLLLLIWFSGMPGVTTAVDPASTDPSTSTSTSSPSLLGLAVAVKGFSKAHDSLREQAGLAALGVGRAEAPEERRADARWQLVGSADAGRRPRDLLGRVRRVGVAEAGLTHGLQAIGVPTVVALSTAIGYRLVTFYLPPLWGSLAMRWLGRSAYL
ncbi:MAG: hypothetical protein WCA29_01755 [Jiangellales bacterium]